MLTNLLATLFITLGMATKTMPICNEKENNNNQNIATIETPKKANENVNEYTLQIGMGTTTTNEANIDTNTNYYYRTRPMTGSNTYLNIIGNYYQTETRSNYDNKCHKIGNYDLLMVDNVYNGLIYNPNAPRSVYVLKITPYEYNIETTLRIRLLVNINGTYNEQSTSSGTQYTYYAFKNMYMNIRQYKCLDNTWDNYLGRQNNQYNPYQIEDDIRNINNGYYYSYDEETLTYEGQLTSNTWNQDIIYLKEITITPNQANYFCFIFEPLAKLSNEWYEENVQAIPSDQTWLYTQTNQSWISRYYSSNPIQISGTNIIPSGTYEVIDIPGMMFEILGMPFTFISTAFNLTIFPNTPYQINISNLFLAVIGLFVFIFLLRLLIKAGLSMGG